MASDSGATEQSGSKRTGAAVRVQAPVDLSDPIDLEVAIKIGKAWRDLRRGASSVAIRDYFFGTEIDAGQMDTLDVLTYRPSWRMSALAEAMRVDPSTATRAVQRLVASDLATRHTDADDGRCVVVTATDTARELHSRIDQRRRFVISRLMSAFTVAERGDLAELMRRFVHELDEVVKDLPSQRNTD